MKKLSAILIAHSGYVTGEHFPVEGEMEWRRREIYDVTVDLPVSE
jgi:hypothetical protein